MDRFARNYLIVLVSAIALAVGYYWLNRDSRVAEINASLALDRELAAYPFPFRVLSLDNGIAVMNSPRSAQVPAMRFLRIAHPELSRTSVDDPAMMAAQDELARIQTLAAERVEQEIDVTAIRWQIDERWFNEHGVFLDLQP